MIKSLKKVTAEDHFQFYHATDPAQLFTWDPATSHVYWVDCDTGIPDLIDYDLEVVDNALSNKQWVPVIH